MRQQGQTPRNIWMLAREYGELAGAGGVKDMVEQLCRALAAWNGRRVSVVLPLYGFLDPEANGFSPLPDPLDIEAELSFEVEMNYAFEERRESVRVWHGQRHRVNLYLLDSQRFREKGDVYTYTAAEAREDIFKVQGEGHFDFFAMNLLHQKAALQLLLLLDERPDIIHCHDGHTATLPAIIAETTWLKSLFRRTGCVVTVHNAGAGYHQDVADLPYARAMTGLPWQTILRCRLAGSFDPLLAAGLYAEVNTVSENYAHELQNSREDEQTGWLGHHLLDQGTTLTGITNGVDPEAFSPLRGGEIGLPAAYDPRDDANMAGKRVCKEDLLTTLADGVFDQDIRRYGSLDGDGEYPLFAFIGRLSGQKGVDVLLEAARQMLEGGESFQLVVLGSGPMLIENQLIQLAEGSPGRGRVCFLAGYSPRLANRIYSAADFFLIPSRYEPCGLTDYLAQLFGTLPIVHHVGGLVKVIDEETGFAYSGNSPSKLAEAMARALAVYGDAERMRRMQKNAIATIEENYTWKEVKNHYLQLYKTAVVQRATGKRAG